jgi:hypothetical protein
LPIPVIVLELERATATNPAVVIAVAIIGVVIIGVVIAIT